MAQPVRIQIITTVESQRKQLMEDEYVHKIRTLLSLSSWSIGIGGEDTWTFRGGGRNYPQNMVEKSGIFLGNLGNAQVFSGSQGHQIWR